jgi:CRISPR type IV-associated protein Csf3
VSILSTPLVVRARLASGIAQAAPWGIAIDGLLAAEMWADRKAKRRDAGELSPRLLDVDTPEDLALPLARCLTPDGLWHWAATCAHPEGRPDVPVDVRYWTGRVDHRALEQLTPHLPNTISDRQGRYRARHMPLLVTPCLTVTWRAVGDAEAIWALLGGITAIGKKRSHGEGHVIGWDVTADPNLDPWTASHLHPDGTLGRPTPPACLAGRSVVDGGRGTAGLRPPYMHPARRHDLHLPALLDG